MPEHGRAACRDTKIFLTLNKKDIFKKVCFHRLLIPLLCPTNIKKANPKLTCNPATHEIVAKEFDVESANVEVESALASSRPKTTSDPSVITLCRRKGCPC